MCYSVSPPETFHQFGSWSSLRCWIATSHHSNIPTMAWFLAVLVVLVSAQPGGPRLKIVWEHWRIWHFLGVGLLRQSSWTCKLQEHNDWYYIISYDLRYIFWFELIWYCTGMICSWCILINHRVARNGPSICCGFAASLLAPFLHSFYIFSHVGHSTINRIL